MQTLYIFLNIIAIICIIILGELSYKNREERYARSFLYVMIFMGIWTIASAMELITDLFFIKILERDIQQVAMAFVPIANYVFVIRYASMEKRIYNRMYQFFKILMIIYTVLLFTDSYHHLLRSKIEMITIGGELNLQVTPTSFGMFFEILRFAIFGVATILLFVFLVQTFKSMRKQVVMIATGFLLAILLLLAKQFWLINIGVMIPMSVILIFPYIFIAIGVFRYDFLSVSPFAKEWIINTLEDGIIVLSKDAHIIEANVSAKRIFAKYLEKKDIEKMVADSNDTEDSSLELMFDNKEEIKYYEVSIHHILTSKNRRRGSVAVVKDITLQKTKQKELMYEVDYDGLTKVLNKHALEREFEHISKDPISMIIIDIDHFKAVNDTYGHPVGDVVLIGVADAMRKSVRNMDLIGRIGGDEFCIVLKECPRELCVSIAERIREMIRMYPYDVTCELRPIEVSIGGVSNVVRDSITFTDMYVKTDEALYKAKELGRNRVEIL